MIKLSFFNLFRRKTRTFLSLLGIGIGIASIIVLISIVNGIEDDFNSALSSLQGIMVLNKEAIDQTLSTVDLSFREKLESLPNVRVALPEMFRVPLTVEGKPNSLSGFDVVSIYGVDVKAYNKLRKPVYSTKVTKGKSLKISDKRKAIIGKGIADKFNKFVGNTIKVNGEKFDIIGIYESETDLLESLIVMPIEDARELVGAEPNEVSSFYIELKEVEKEDEVVNTIKFRFTDDLEAFSSSSSSDIFSGIFGNFRLVVFFVAVIAAIVAGVGIINTILMSVFERKKEIGSLIAVGWTKKDVIKMIMYESFFIGILGGLFGLVIGLIINTIISLSFGLNVPLRLDLLVLSLVFALIVGLVAGIYPAIVASNLNPVDALRSG